MIGVEFASLFNGLGSKVTILEMLPQIVSTEDEEVIRGLKILLEKQGITLLTQARVLSATVGQGRGGSRHRPGREAGKSPSVRR